MRTLFAVPLIPSQEPLLTAHCFGDCGKIAIGALNMGDDIGHCFVCVENNCPYEKGRIGPMGTSQQTGEVIWLRGLTNVKGREESPATNPRTLSAESLRSATTYAAPKGDQHDSTKEKPHGHD